MGFIEETGAAQYYRDARILPIYEGTNGIQAADLVFRKLLRDGGAGVDAYINTLSADISEDHIALLKSATRHLLKLNGEKKLDEIAWLAMPYLKGFSLIAGAAMMKRIAKTSAHILDHVSFYETDILPHARAYLSPFPNK
jgi:3-(methylthio)propanoyl-CoA dehydrogenase